jgi:hypothetical protein
MIYHIDGRVNCPFVGLCVQHVRCLVDLCAMERSALVCYLINVSYFTYALECGMFAHNACADQLHNTCGMPLIMYGDYQAEMLRQSNRKEVLC